MYDIYLSAPIANDQEILGLRTQKGFLNLNLSFDEAIAFLGNLVLKQILRGDVSTRMIPVEYRDKEKIGIENAFSFARIALEKRLRQHPSDIAYEDPIFTGESHMWYVFLAKPKEREGYKESSRGIFYFVDKLDGHLWNGEEADRYLISIADALDRFISENEASTEK